MTTKQLNKALEVVRLDGVQFNTPNGVAKIYGYGFYVAGKGYLQFNTDVIPYTPCGGKEVLENIVQAGGFLNYNNIIFVQPIK